ncbi:MAG: hypothetical protein JW915_00205 [Chitinispirillaceae bacterium]|nr:hypothetical protein [Chitinispirillaceae bacterium]
MRKNSEAATTPTPDIADADWEKLEPESAYVKKCRMTWAALIKAVYEVDPLKCPTAQNYNGNGALWHRKSLRSRSEADNCGGTMMVRLRSPTKIISFIEDDATIQNPE